MLPVLPVFGDGCGGVGLWRFPALPRFSTLRTVQGRDGRDGPGRFGSSMASGRLDGVDALRGVEAKRTRL